MPLPSLRLPGVLMICLTASVGCNRSNNAEVEVARAEAQTLKAELAKAKARADAAEAELTKVKAAQSQPKAVDADRRAAEWVVRVGGVVRVLAEGVNREYPREGKLPDTPFKVTFVNIVEPGNQNKLTNEGVKYLAGLKHLKSLEMTPNGVDDFSFLEGMDSLERFHGSIRDAALVHLKNRKGIKELAVGFFWGNKNFTDAGLAQLKELKNLEVLDLSGCDITDAGLENLRSFNGLRWLNVFRTRLTGAGFQHLKGLTELRELHMAETEVADAGLEHLKGLPKLAVINVGGSKVTDAGLMHFQGLPKLEGLHLDGNKVTDTGLAHLKGVSNLRQLSLKDTMVTDDGVKALKAALPTCSVTK
jgi:hypothetical protein